MKRPRSLVTILSILIVGIVIFAGAFSGWNYISSIFQAASTSTKKVSLNIQSGETTNGIAADLQSKGVIRNAQAFSILARIRGLDTKLQAGVYTKITPAMSASQIIDILQKGQPDEILLVIPEGMRLEQIAAIASASNLPNFNKAQFLGYAKNIKTFPDASKYPLLLNSVPADHPSMEGLLFPDTYELSPTATASDVIDTMLAEMTKDITKYDLVAKAQQHQMNLYELLTFASIVQREAGSAKDMPNIASVYWDRIYTDNGKSETGGGKMQADPTVQYARDTDSPPKEYWAPLDNTGDKIAVDSKWNTYNQLGLPPTPICSPGLTSLQAAANPPNTGYLYFFAAKDDGQTYFQKSLDEFDAAVAAHGGANNG
jgi:UPF0755 protein